MVIFLDTSALYALASGDDINHEKAVARFGQALQEGAEFMVHNLIIIETVALLQKRKGYKASRRLVHESARFKLVMIDKKLHGRVLAKYADSGNRKLSMVDLFSFAVMRHEGVKAVLTFDKHFEKEGFRIYGK